MRLNRAAAGAIATILLTGLAACGDDEPDNGTEPTTPTESTATEPTPTEPETTEPATDEDKAAAALLGYLEVRDNAYRTKRVSKELNKYATGREHFNLQTFVQGLRDTGNNFEGEYVHEVIKTRQSGPEEVLATDCEDRAAVTALTKGGEKIELTDEDGNPLPNPLRQTYRVVLDGQQWKVESIVGSPGKNAQSC